MKIFFCSFIVFGGTFSNFLLFAVIVLISSHVFLGSCQCGAAVMSSVFVQMYSTDPQREIQSTT